MQLIKVYSQYSGEQKIKWRKLYTIFTVNILKRPVEYSTERNLKTEQIGHNE